MANPHIQRATSLPIPLEFPSDEAYIDSLLRFSTSNQLFQHLCGGVHILDFLTQEPDLYSSLLPQEWRDWLQNYEIQDILNFLIWVDLSTQLSDAYASAEAQECGTKVGKGTGDQSSPPPSLVDYVSEIRRHTLVRDLKPDCSSQSPAVGKSCTLTRTVATGMKPKKIHEVGNFVQYIDKLIDLINSDCNHQVSHLVDFGSGQNYLGRALASPPYFKNVVAIESKSHNIEGAKTLDVTAKLAKNEKILRNKKAFRSRRIDQSDDAHTNALTGKMKMLNEPLDRRASDNGAGSIQYVERVIKDGDLSDIMPQIQQIGAADTDPYCPQLLVISLHSCGNLLHHGLQSLVLNPSVKAVAMVGCCYNLVTERLGPATYKIPSLRRPNLRLDKISATCDPHGFPMSECLSTYKHLQGEGIRLNITARMMAVQAPQNWTPRDSEAFFTKHFYRALLQRIFVDRGVVGSPSHDHEESRGSGPRGWTGTGEPIILGSLRKPCYSSFVAYAREAMAKLRDDPAYGPRIATCIGSLSDEDLAKYEEQFSNKKKELSVVWSLMAFSAGVVESIIVVDRWLYLKEQDIVRECWVEAIFDYRQSPRNLVIVAIKK